MHQQPFRGCTWRSRPAPHSIDRDPLGHRRGWRDAMCGSDFARWNTTRHGQRGGPLRSTLASDRASGTPDVAIVAARFQKWAVIAMPAEFRPPRQPARLGEGQISGVIARMRSTTEVWPMSAYQSRMRMQQPPSAMACASPPGRCAVRVILQLRPQRRILGQLEQSGAQFSSAHGDRVSRRGDPLHN